MKNLWKYSGTILAATGVLHSMVGLISGRQGHAAIMRDGFVNVVKDDLERNMAFWFLVRGVVVILFGLTLQYYIKATQKPAPAFLGWAMPVFPQSDALSLPLPDFGSFCRRHGSFSLPGGYARKQLLTLN